MRLIFTAWKSAAIGLSHLFVDDPNGILSALNFGASGALL
jgi:hypothetical protein